MSDKPEVTITLRSYDIDKFGAHHNAVSVYFGEEEAFTIHGMAVNREKGGVEAVGDNDDTLRALIIPGNRNDLFDMPINGEHTIFEGTAEEAAPIMLAAFDAVKYINDQNLNYDPFEVFGTSQNSNSVAHTIVEAMEQKFPEESEKYWAPGHDRILLPEDWKSIYLMESTSDEIKTQALQRPALEKIDPIHVLQQAMDDPIPNRHNIFYDREEPFAPYTPFGQDMPFNPNEVVQGAPDAQAPDITETPASHSPLNSHMKM